MDPEDNILSENYLVSMDGTLITGITMMMDSLFSCKQLEFMLKDKIHNLLKEGQTGVMESTPERTELEEV